MRQRHVIDGLWLAAGVVLTALGTLAGTRMLTSLLLPQEFGVLNLTLGACVLALNLACAPFTQAAIHFYAVFAAHGRVDELRAQLRRSLTRSARWIVLALVAGAVYAAWRGIPLVMVGLLAIYIAAEGWRAVELSFLNLQRRHRAWVLWMVLDAWLKPAAAALAIELAGASPVLAFACYVGVSLALLALFTRRTRDDAVPEAEEQSRYLAPDAAELPSRMWQYAAPLVPLGFISWSIGLGDRYIIGALLGLADAGAYAAAYGLSSAPFMMFSNIAEQGFRPVYQRAVSGRDELHARRVLGWWLTTVIIVSAVGVMLFALLHSYLASWFLGEKYHYAASLMPWIALGYAARAVSYVFERICHAYGRTGAALLIQSCAGVAGLLATPLAIVAWGLHGAALAVPVAFTAQLALAIGVASAVRRRAASAALSYSVISGNDPGPRRQGDVVLSSD
jgi:O-antigen/teichoic acid export membrane protein